MSAIARRSPSQIMSDGVDKLDLNGEDGHACSRHNPSTAEQHRSLILSRLTGHGFWSLVMSDGDEHGATRSNPRGCETWWEELTGQTNKEQHASPTAWADVVHPDDRERALRAWHDGLQSGRAFDVEYRVATRAGRWAVVRARGEALVDSAGVVREWVGSLQDVTEHSLNAGTAAASRMFETVLSNTPDFVYMFDSSARFTFVNRALLKLWGKSAAETLGKTFFELDYTPELAARLHEQVLRVFRTGIGLCDETEYGDEVPPRSYEYIFTPVLGADGRVEAVTGSTRDITARKTNEIALRTSESRYRALVTASSDVVYRMSPDWSEMSPVDGRGFIPSTSQPLRDWMTQNVPEFEHSRVKNAIARAIAEKATFELEHQVRRIDGTLGWTFSRAVPILDDAGNIVEWFGTAADITARKRAVSDLRDIRSRMDAALNAAAIGTWAWDIPGDKFYGDASFARMFGVPLNAVDGGPLDPIFEVIHTEDQPRVAEAIRATIETGTFYQADYRVRSQEGTWRWVSARGRVERDAQGRAVRFPGVVIDVTDQKEAQKELSRVQAEAERRRRLYDTILTNTPDLAYVFDLDHRFIYANNVLLRMWGRTWDEAIGKTCHELGYEAWHASMHDQEIEQVKSTRQPIRGEVPFNGTFGRRIYEYIFVPVLGADGQVEAVAGTTRDVTDRKNAEEALRDADRKKDDFIALLAHELRNPLAPIRSGLQMTRLAKGDQQMIDKARMIMERQLAHMVRLIDDLLDVSRITRNKMELRRTHVSLADVVANAVEAATPAIQEARHRLTVTLPPEPVMFNADLTRLAQVLSNLLTNSARYTPVGGQIWLSGERDGDDAVIRVRDSGIGIPASSLSKIFDMFSQVDRSVERSTGGLGIGLALVKGLVEMHGGRVSAESVEGQGSTFTVRLPTILMTHEHDAHAKESDGNAAARRRVLVVDDNHDGAESMAELLKMLGSEVRVAHDGAAAVSTAAEFRPDVILMDIGLPVMNGLDATRRIRRETWGEEMAIYALTGWGQDSDRQLSREAGCTGHLVKPVEFADLERLMNASPSRG